MTKKSNTWGCGEDGDNLLKIQQQRQTQRAMEERQNWWRYRLNVNVFISLGLQLRYVISMNFVTSNVTGIGAISESRMWAQERGNRKEPQNPP